MADIVLKNIIGQARPREILQRILEHGRLANGYLFVGPEGVGKVATAIEFARAIFCSNESVRPCGECSACRRVGGLRHPDFLYVFPKPKTASVEDERAVLDSVAENPYLRTRMWAAPVIGIDQIRELRKASALRPTENRRVVLISEAEKMTAEASNSLLKLLEEPPHAMHLILTTSLPSALLPTITSRCQEIKFGMIPDDEIEAALIREKNVEPDEARLIASISQGSYGRALEWLDEDWHERRELAVEFLRTALRDHLARLKLVDEIVDQYDKGTVKELLSLMLIWFRDALVLSAAGDGADSTQRIVNHDQLETLQKFVSAFGHIDYDRAFAEIEKAIELIERNVHLHLLLVVLLTRLRRILVQR